MSIEWDGAGAHSKEGLGEQEDKHTALMIEIKIFLDCVGYLVELRVNCRLSVLFRNSVARYSNSYSNETELNGHE